MVACSNFLERSRFSSMIFTFAATYLAWFANAKDADLIGKPKFSYVERDLVKITYNSRANCTLKICCNASRLLAGYGKQPNYFQRLVANWSCVEMPHCPKYKSLSTCKTHGQEVCCKVKHVRDNITLKSYIARIGQNEEISSRQIATYVTKKSEEIPRSVTDLVVTANLNQGLTVQWTPLTEREYNLDQAEEYSQKVDCQPLENGWAKAVSKEVKTIFTYRQTINGKNISGVTKYRCCVKVVNGVTSYESEQVCTNVTTGERAPSSPPVITCGNDTACPYVVQGTKRNITVKFSLPSPEKRNGKIIQHEVFYKNSTAVNMTKLVIRNGSVTEVVIPGAETGASYDIFMKSCTVIGCSSISNTVRIPAVGYHTKVDRPIVQILVPIVAAVCGLVLLGIVVCLKRHRRLERAKQLPKLEMPTNTTAYEYPWIAQDENYSELSVEGSLSEKPSDSLTDYKIVIVGAGATVIVNSNVPAAVNA